MPPRTPTEPPGLEDGSAAAVLDEAEEILNAIGAQMIAEVEAERAQQKSKGLKRFFRRRPKD